MTCHIHLPAVAWVAEWDPLGDFAKSHLGRSLIRNSGTGSDAGVGYLVAETTRTRELWPKRISDHGKGRKLDVIEAVILSRDDQIGRSRPEVYPVTSNSMPNLAEYFAQPTRSVPGYIRRYAQPGKILCIAVQKCARLYPTACSTWQSTLHSCNVIDLWLSTPGKFRSGVGSRQPLMNQVTS